MLAGMVCLRFLLAGSALLCAAMLLRARDEGLPMPAAAVLSTPETDLTESGDTHQVVSSMSAKTGVAPTYRVGAALAIQVMSGTMTSSPSPMPRPANARWIAEVQWGTAIA